MSEGAFLQILGKTDLGPVGVALIEKLSAGTAAITKPIGTIMNAWADVQAEKIKSVGKIEIEAAQRRAIERELGEAMTHQKNLESIYGKTYAMLENDPDVTPESIRQIEDDWVSFHSVRARYVSDQEMQDVWARIFAEEAKRPGSFSKRTMAFIETLEKEETNLFNELCAFVIYDDSARGPALAIPLEEGPAGGVFNAIFTDRGITHLALRHLDSIGLVSYPSGFVPNNVRDYDSRSIHLRYRNHKERFQLPQQQKRPGQYYVIFGVVDFTPLGWELFRLATPAEIPNYFDYCQSVWRRHGIYPLPESWDFERDGILLTGGSAPDGSPPADYLRRRSLL